MIREKKFNIPFAISLIVSVTLLIILSLAVLGLSGQDKEDKAVQLKAVLERAAVQCYALEGEYPPNVEYLEENYGVIIDRDRFFIRYDVTASNMRPTIMVFEN